MTDREKAIVMAYTGICMLTGDKFQIFHKYVEDIMGRPVFTHEMYALKNEIKEKSTNDFLALCAEQEPCEDSISRKALLERINNAEENFKHDHIESISSDVEDPFVDGVLSGVFNIKLMVLQAPSVKPTQKWIPIISREPTQEEKDDYFANNGEELCFMVQSEMPMNGQEVLVSSGGYVAEDVFDEDYFDFENNDLVNVDAWMPLPKPYRESEG